VLTNHIVPARLDTLNDGYMLAQPILTENDPLLEGGA
jgi:hypothetical protein